MHVAVGGIRGAVVAASVVSACGAPELASISIYDTRPDATVLRDVTVFDGAGRTLLPGLIDSHAHLFSAGEKSGPPPDPEVIARSFLYAGVTTVLVAARLGDETALRDAQRAGEVVAPNLYTAGHGLTAPGGHPICLLRAMLPWPVSWFAIRDVSTAADAASARDRVDATIAEDDLDFFKIVYDDLPSGSPHLSREALVGAIEAARKQGVRAIVHATTPDDALTAVEAGASFLVHVPQRGILTQE